MKMSRFEPYFGIVAALAIGILIAVFSGRTTMVHAPTTIIVSNVSSSTSPITNSAAATSTQSVPIPENISPKQTLKLAPVPVSVNLPAVSESVSETNALLDTSASALRAALVNIICDAPAGSAIHSISGSGIFIDTKGIILTNAHIGQYSLLSDRGVSCTIRSGSPATDKYNAALIYISPLWLRANPDVLTQTNPSGTGEYDFAFLAVTKSATVNPLPSSFPSLPLATMPPAALTPVVIASYGAQFLESSQIASNLSPTIVFGSVKDVFTFVKNTVDVIALGGSAAAQEGSSGGGVANAFGSLVGIITTSTISGATDTRSLDAITSSYIRSEYATEMGSALDLLLAEPTSTSVADFALQISILESIVTAHLP
jgi:hypothetical protein